MAWLPSADRFAEQQVTRTAGTGVAKSVDGVVQLPGDGTTYLSLAQAVTLTAPYTIILVGKVPSGSDAYFCGNAATTTDWIWGTSASGFRLRGQGTTAVFGNPVSGKTSVFVICCDNKGSNAFRVYQDGVSLGADSNGIGAVSMTLASIGRGRSDVAAMPANSALGMVAAIPGYAMSAAEALRIGSKPWGLLAPQQRPLFVPISTGGAATYNDTLAESWTAADSIASLLATAGSISESVSLGDSVASVAVMNCSMSESEALSDSLNAALTMASALSAQVSVSDVLTNSASFLSSLAESTSLSDAFVASIVFTAGLSEGISLADAYVGATGPATYNETIAAALTLADSLISAGTMAVTLSASVALIDAVSNGNVFVEAISESLALAELTGASNNLPAAIAESVAIAETLGATHVQLALIGEGVAVSATFADSNPTVLLSKDGRYVASSRRTTTAQRASRNFTATR